MTTFPRRLAALLTLLLWMSSFFASPVASAWNGVSSPASCAPPQLASSKPAPSAQKESHKKCCVPQASDAMKCCAKPKSAASHTETLQTHSKATHRHEAKDVASRVLSEPDLCKCEAPRRAPISPAPMMRVSSTTEDRIAEAPATFAAILVRVPFRAAPEVFTRPVFPERHDITLYAATSPPLPARAPPAL